MGRNLIREKLIQEESFVVCHLTQEVILTSLGRQFLILGRGCDVLICTVNLERNSIWYYFFQREWWRQFRRVVGDGLAPGRLWHNHSKLHLIKTFNTFVFQCTCNELCDSPLQDFRKQGVPSCFGGLTKAYRACSSLDPPAPTPWIKMLIKRKMVTLWTVSPLFHFLLPQAQELQLRLRVTTHLRAADQVRLRASPELHCQAGIRSLTQFYSFAFLQTKIIVKKCFF